MAVAAPSTHGEPTGLGRTAMLWFLASDAFSFFGVLLAYGMLRSGAAEWRSEGEPALNLPFTVGLTALLLLSSVSMARAVRPGLPERSRGGWLALTALFGALFLLGQAEEWFGVLGVFSHGLAHEGLVFGESHYATTFYVVTGFHGLHVLIGVLLLVGALVARAELETVKVIGLFWQFVDIVWLFVFGLVYLL